MRVLLVNLGSGDTDFIDKGRVWKSVYRRPYLGLGYLSAFLKQHGHAVDLLDRQVEAFGPDALAGRVRDGRYDLVGFFAIYVNREDVLAHARRLRELVDVPIVVGGPDCFNDRSYLEAGIDWVVHGEGERSTLELIRHLEGELAEEELLGVACLRDGELRRAPERPLIEDLDALPYPDRSQYPIEVWHDYMDFNMRKPFTQIITARGCPYRCDFCDSPSLWRRRVRQRSVENVLAEVDEVVERFGVRYVLFADDIFGISFDWHAEFCERLAARGHDLRWMCLLHPLVYGKRTEERVELMARAGCRTVHMGVQSSSAEVLERSGRYRQEIERHKQIIAACRANGVLTFTSFMHGLPGDTRDVFESNRAFVIDLDPHYALFLPLKIFAGSNLERRLESGEVSLPGFSHAELVRSCRKSEFRFYMSPRRIARLVGYILRHNPRWFLTKAWYAVYMMVRTVWVGLGPAQAPLDRDSSTLSSLQPA